MNKRPYSASAVKHSFWFLEFQKEVELLSQGKSFADIKVLNQSENIFGAPTTRRAEQIYLTVTARISSLDDSMYSLFMNSDLSTRKLIALSAALAYDSLFLDFVYEVIRDKMILGVNEVTDTDLRVFLANKQSQDERLAAWKDYTLHRLGVSYKTQLFEAGLLDGNAQSNVRKIYRPILDSQLEHWLKDNGYDVIARAIAGER